MKIHRFYLPEVELRQEFWLHDEKLLQQWNNVLRFKEGQELVLFDGIEHDKLYKIDEIKPSEAHLVHVTDFERQLPKKNIYLMWSLLKKDKNDWILQKATELGVSHFIPLITERCERSNLSANRVDRWQKIVIEAAEQCGRSDIPSIREPIKIETAIDQFGKKLTLYVCDQGSEDGVDQEDENIGILIGPEGGWSDAEKQLFKEKSMKHLSLHDFTLRAETAAITAVSSVI